MSKSVELLQRCMIEKGFKSYYALAKEMNLHSGLISDYMSEKRTPDAYAAVRMALILKRDPVEIIAEIEADTAKNPARKTFWTDFLQRAKSAAQRGTLALLFGLTLLGGLATAEGGFSRYRRFA
jgi:transcriptional regulator with XRE-family HTH domain